MTTPRLLDDDLVRAAEILEREAERTRASYTVDGKWIGARTVYREVKAEHDEMRALAKRFRKIAGTL